MFKLDFITTLTAIVIATSYMAKATPFNPVMKIAGGNNTTVTAFPFAVHLLYDEINTCTGSIIGDRWILTAAHCVVAVKESEEAGKIILNDPSKYGINIGLNSNINNNLVIPKKIYAHPKYNGTTISHDVGLLELRRPLKFTNAIQSVKLINDTSKLSVDQMFTAIGWGRDQTQKLTPKLNRVDLPNGSTEFCTEVNPDYPLYSDQLLCTEDVPGKDTCLGDSGGPLLVEIANSNSTVGEKAAAAWLQAGVTSFGHNLLDKNTEICGLEGNMGFYARIDHFIPWIAKTTRLSVNKFTAPLPAFFEIN